MTNQIPQRQLRAHYDDTTITLYQAYSSAIADPALAAQRLTAAPAFSTTRMTWLKPSWCWMMYRSGYSYKDPRQERILSLRMTHAAFRELLAQAVLTDGAGKRGGLSREERERDVRVQWDPERGVRLQGLGWRSIQIGVGGGVARRWVESGVMGIEDVTGRAREMKRVVEREEGVGVEELVRMGLMPVERVLEVGEELRAVLRMDE